ncbi:DUF5694 domain-containing protein [Kangiella japonica]|uniref:DUF5694 domain-containing protein n=1 Tax=Kangiella japonica TaxID=647384 RepID=UPI003CD06966
MYSDPIIPHFLIYCNLYRIRMTKDGRVFILMGRAHTVFLREFIKRSPKSKWWIR